MWELDYKESWALKTWCFWTVVLEKTLESPLYCKEIKPVHPKGNQSWIFIGRTDAETETPILWPPDVKNWLIWKDPDARKDRRQEQKGTTEDEMVGWHHRLDGHEFEQAPGAGDGQGSLACCSPWGRIELDTTERLNWTESKVQRRKQLTQYYTATDSQKPVTFSYSLKKIIYFWLCWVFVAAYGLSPVSVSEGYSSLLCSGFSLQWLLLLQSMGCRFAGFSSCNLEAQ